MINSQSYPELSSPRRIVELRGLAYGRDVYQQSSAELPSQRATNCANAEVRFNTCLRCTGHLICRMGVQTESGAKRLEIKKYPNRRYYDATHSRHLTLDEIQSLIQQGYDLRVVDARTKADITAQVLTQIILELDTPKIDSLPVPLLVRIIRMNDQLVKDFIEKYFNQALKSFLDYQQQVEEHIRRTHGLPSAFPSVSAWTKAVLEPIASVFSASRPGAESTTAGSDFDEARLKETVRALQAQLAEEKRRHSRRRPAARGRKRS